ncbi:MAG: recombinase A [Acidobacteria bacterium]|nr:recombinase A [Acidobacteriota bacterium]
MRAAWAIPSPSTPSTVPAWSLGDFSGRLIELSGGQAAAHLTAAFGLVLEAQLCGDRAAWVTLEPSTFFPPDAAAGGVDVEALPVVRVPDMRAAGRAADHLVRSGGFGLVVIDLSGESPDTQARPATLPVPLLARLLGLARAHDVAVLLLTKKSPDASSINSLISLRAEAQWHAIEGRYEVRVRVLKDKRGGPGWTHLEACRGPAGLR